MIEFPKSSWLVVACDLPFLDKATLSQLVSERNIFKMATYFKDHVSGLPEPLCALYEPKARYKLMDSLADGINCPRKILMKSSCKGILPQNIDSLRNINHKHEYKKVQIELGAAR